MFSIARVFCRQSCLLRKNCNFKPTYFSINTSNLGKRRRIVDTSDEEESNISVPLKEKPLTDQLNSQDKKINSPVNKKSKVNVDEKTKIKKEKVTPNRKSSSKNSTKSSLGKVENQDVSIEPVKEEKPDRITEEKSPEPTPKIKEIKLQLPGQGSKGAEYDPLQTKYHPINDAFWKKGDK